MLSAREAIAAPRLSLTTAATHDLYPDLPPATLSQASASSKSGSREPLRLLASKRSIADWITDIEAMWSNGAANTLALAKLVSAARESLRARGEWTRLWRVGLPRLPFCRRKAEMLAVIGRELGELSAQTFARMPSGWSPLYYLAKLGRRTVEKLIATGRIHPDLTLHQAKDLLAEFEPGRKRHGPGSVLHFRLARFVAFLERASPGWSPTERRLVRATLLRLAEQLAQPRAGMKTPSTAPVLTCNSDNFKSVQ